MKVFNRKAKFNYKLTPEKVEAGIALKGIEAKAFRNNRIDLSQSFVKVINKEVFLINANIPAKGIKDYQPTRTRKLLLHKSEIIKLETKMKRHKLQLVPIVMYNQNKKIKLKLALGKSKRKFEKKESLKKKDIQREIEKQFKDNY